MSDVTTSTIKRVLSALVALPVYVIFLYTDMFYSLPVLAVSLIVTLACLFEYYQISGRDENQKPFLWAGLIAGAAVNAVMYLYAFGGLRLVKSFDARVMLALVALFTCSVLVYQIFRRPIQGGIYSLAVTVFGVIYIVFGFSHLILLKAVNDGFYHILVLNIVVMLNDTFAYFGGVLFGRHKTGFAVSPNKSWEGYFSGLLFSVLSMIISTQVLKIFFGRDLGFGILEAALVGIGLSLLGHLGDLVESAVKRDGSIKDSGSIIPGHGGMWDVFDALIFSMPFYYYYLVLKGMA